MIKKIVAGVLAVLVLVLAGFKLFFNKDNTPKKMMDVKENLTSYHMEANMEISSSDDKRNFFVQVDYKKDSENDLFKISILDKNINQEQIMLRNKEGVFVLTPALNQVYSFKGDYPLNGQKPYLYHSMLSALEGDYNLEKVSDGYVLSFAPKYENSPNWVNEDVKLSTDFKPVWVNIYDSNNSIVCSVNFTKVEFDVKFEDDDFNVEICMNKAKESAADINRSEEDLPFKVVSNLINSELSQQTEATVDGKTVYILAYRGNQNFTIIQSIIDDNEEINYSAVNGTLVNFDRGIGFYNNSYLTYIYNGIKYEVYSDTLKVSEMIDIVSSLDVIEEK